jgi:murein DD-endopeptidase MepM/ murein hydrolase activator NlpD
VPHQSPRLVGRHRRESKHRHRAGNPRGTVALTATLGAALVTGVAGGSAAAAATHRVSATAATSHHVSAAGHHVSATVVRAAQSGSGVIGIGIDPESPWNPPALPLGSAADGVRQKVRPQPLAVTATAAWVDPNPSARVSSCFGMRWGRMHEGVDLAAPDGTPIVAAGAGIVVRAGVAEGYGNAVLIDHGNGFLTHYGHLSAVTVTVGQHVAAGQQIGNEGSTGHSTGPHLHFEVHQGFYQNPIEPTRWMHEHGVDIPGCVPFG